MLVLKGMFIWPTMNFKCNCHNSEHTNPFICSTAFKGRFQVAQRIRQKKYITSKQSLLQKATIPINFHTYSIHVYIPLKWTMNFNCAHQDWLMGGLTTHSQLLTATTGYRKRCVNVCHWGTLVPNTASIFYLLCSNWHLLISICPHSKKVSNRCMLYFICDSRVNVSTLMH